jgi:hypothetical protein
MNHFSDKLLHCQTYDSDINLVTARLCELSYEDSIEYVVDSLDEGETFLGHFDELFNRCFLIGIGDTVIITFRGSDNLFNFFEDIDFLLITVDVPNHGHCRVSQGFYLSSTSVHKSV